MRFKTAWNSVGEMNDPIPYLERQLKDVVKKIHAYEDWKHAFGKEEAFGEEEEWQPLEEGY